jgi:hypothetical protein
LFDLWGMVVTGAMTAMCVCKQLGAWPSRKVRSCENYCRHGTDGFVPVQ